MIDGYIDTIGRRRETNESFPDAAHASSSWRAWPRHDDVGATAAPLGALIPQRILCRERVAGWAADTDHPEFAIEAIIAVNSRERGRRRADLQNPGTTPPAVYRRAGGDGR